MMFNKRNILIEILYYSYLEFNKIHFFIELQIRIGVLLIIVLIEIL